jgi:hypothetical protein
MMKLRSFALLAAAAMATLPTMAQAQMLGMLNVATRPGMTGMGHMMGTHVMPVTVTAVDVKNGLVEGTAGGATLKLHFPPESLGGVKPGDQLSVMLAFSK